MDAMTTVLPSVDSPAVTARRTLGGQVARFAVVGVLCTGVHLGLFTVFHSWWDSQLANVAALVLAGAGNWVRQQLQALGVFLLTWAATSGGLALLETAWPTAPLVVKVLALAALTAVSTVVRFVAMRRWIFAGGHDPAVGFRHRTCAYLCDASPPNRTTAGASAHGIPKGPSQATGGAAAGPKPGRLSGRTNHTKGQPQVARTASIWMRCRMFTTPSARFDAKGEPSP
jgi:putative flippase GtrA